MNKKVCPLVETVWICNEQCPWRIDGDCAVAVIAKSLHNLKETWGKAGEE